MRNRIDGKIGIIIIWKNNNMEIIEELR